MPKVLSLSLITILAGAGFGTVAAESYLESQNAMWWIMPGVDMSPFIEKLCKKFGLCKEFCNPKIQKCRF